MAQQTVTNNHTLTAVEWFEQNISKYIHYQYEKAYEQHEEVTKIFEQAKQMEKEQIINAFDNGKSAPPNYVGYGSQYFYETYEI